MEGNKIKKADEFYPPGEIVWDADDQPASFIESRACADWLVANGIRAGACAASPCQVIRSGRDPNTGKDHYCILWEEIVAGPDEKPAPDDMYAIWPKGINHEWGTLDQGALSKAKVRRFTYMRVPPPGFRTSPRDHMHAEWMGRMGRKDSADALCPKGCGQPLSESTDPANEGQYEALPLPTRCHACTALEEAKSNYVATYGDKIRAPGALTWTVRRKDTDR